jgi:hypothetical protein
MGVESALGLIPEASQSLYESLKAAYEDMEKVREA